MIFIATQNFIFFNPLIIANKQVCIENEKIDISRIKTKRLLLIVSFNPRNFEIKSKGSSNNIAIRHIINALKTFILKLVDIILIKSFSDLSYSEVYFTIPFSIPKVLNAFPNLKKSLNWPIKNIPDVPKNVAIILNDMPLAIKLIAVLKPDKNDVLIKFIDYNLKSSHSEKSYTSLFFNDSTSSR